MNTLKLFEMRVKKCWCATPQNLRVQAPTLWRRHISHWCKFEAPAIGQGKGAGSFGGVFVHNLLLNINFIGWNSQASTQIQTIQTEYKQMQIIVSFLWRRLEVLSMRARPWNLRHYRRRWSHLQCEWNRYGPGFCDWLVTATSVKTQT